MGADRPLRDLGRCVRSAVTFTWRPTTGPARPDSVRGAPAPDPIPADPGSWPMFSLFRKARP